MNKNGNGSMAGDSRAPALFWPLGPKIVDATPLVEKYVTPFPTTLTNKVSQSFHENCFVEIVFVCCD